MGAKRNIVVAGDVSIDWYTFPYDAKHKKKDGTPAAKGNDTDKEPANWKQHASSRQQPIAGGAYLLTRFLVEVLRANGKDQECLVHGPKLPAILAHVSPERIIHSQAQLEKFQNNSESRRECDAKTLRVKEMLGYVGPAEGGEPQNTDDKTVYPPTAEVVVLDDAGNGFREQDEIWPNLDGAGLIVYKMSRPLAKGKLWEKLCAGKKEGGELAKKLVVLVRADDLRLSEGVNITKGLSWERTASDFVFHFLRQSALDDLRQCPNLVVVFGTDGAMLCQPGQHADEESFRIFTLIYDPESLEEVFTAGIPGRMIGGFSVFTAALVARLSEEGLGALENAVIDGLSCIRKLYLTGFREVQSVLDYQMDQLFGNIPSSKKGPCSALKSSQWEYQSIRIMPPNRLQHSEVPYWRILDKKITSLRQKAAKDIVLHGIEKSGNKDLKTVPLGKFGKVLTVDRAEIESYNIIRELMQEFLDDQRPSRPLSLAVFGPPGSGKSFGVKQVLKSLGTAHVEKISFNVSQFSGYQDLIAAFHKVRDIVLNGKTPCVFFDEFDSSCGGDPLGWLKYFLAPMQDGEFLDGETVYHIGKAIFIFAGGTCSSYEDFAAVRISSDKKTLTEKEQAAEVKKSQEYAKKVKKPDFLSRLRGFINIMGPNRQRRENDYDEAFIIRRAILLRAMLKGNQKTKGLFDQNKRLLIDEGILRAFLNISNYKHGARSIEAIIDMSRLMGKKRYDQSSLPPRELLEMHVNADEFMWLVERPRFHSMLSLAELEANCCGEWTWEKEKELIEVLAVELHKDYNACRKAEAEGTGKQYVEIPFAEIAEDQKDSNRDAAADIPFKLESVGYGLQSILSDKKSAESPVSLSSEKVTELASREHERWCREKYLKGYGFDPKVETKNREEKKKHDQLKPSKELVASERKKDTEAIEAIIKALWKMNYTLVKLSDKE